MSDDLPRAVREAVMLDGKLEVYDLGGMYVFSSRGAISALTGARARTGSLDIYTRGFIAESNGNSLGQVRLHGEVRLGPLELLVELEAVIAAKRRAA